MMTFWTPEKVIEVLNVSDHIVERAIIVLERRSEVDRHMVGRTRRGFLPVDRVIGGGLAAYLNMGLNLKGKMLGDARDIAVRHAQQVADEFNIIALRILRKFHG